MRKQDNSKLIFLLIGVVAIFILVFQYKSWCSAAEFEIVENYSEDVEEVISSIPLDKVVVDDEGVSEFISEAPILEATSETVVQNFDDSAIVDELVKLNNYFSIFLGFSSSENDFDYSYSDFTSFDGLALNSSNILTANGSSYGFYIYFPFGANFTCSLASKPSWANISFCALSSLENGVVPLSFVSLLDSTSGQLTFSSSDPFYLYVYIVSSSSSNVSYLSSLSVDGYFISTSVASFSELTKIVDDNTIYLSDICVYVLITCCFVCCFISLQIAWHTRSQIRKWSGKDSH